MGSSNLSVLLLVSQAGHSTEEEPAPQGRKRALRGHRLGRKALLALQAARACHCHLCPSALEAFFPLLFVLGRKADRSVPPRATAVAPISVPSSPWGGCSHPAGMHSVLQKELLAVPPEELLTSRQKDEFRASGSRSSCSCRLQRDCSSPPESCLRAIVHISPPYLPPGLLFT